MTNVVKFPTGVVCTKILCACGHGLEYWVGSDQSAYGICPHCDLNQPKVIELDNEWSEE